MSQAGSAKRRGVFIRIALPDGLTVLRLWLGFGDIEVPTNDLDVGDEVYSGLGTLVGVPALEDAINGKSSRMDLTLSGVTAEMAALAAQDAAGIRNAEVAIGACKFDDAWQMDGGVIWLADRVADVLKIAMAGQPTGGQAYTVTLSIGSANAGRSRAEYATWTDAQHQKAHPGDLFFNNVPPAEAKKPWPGG